MIVLYTLCTYTLLKGAGAKTALPSSYYATPIPAHYDHILIILQIHESRARTPSFCVYYDRTMIILVYHPYHRHYAGTTTFLLLYYDSMSLVLRLYISASTTEPLLSYYNSEQIACTTLEKRHYFYSTMIGVV